MRQLVGFLLFLMLCIVVLPFCTEENDVSATTLQNDSQARVYIGTSSTRDERGFPAIDSSTRVVVPPQLLLLLNESDPNDVRPGGKARYSVVYGNLDDIGTTWVRHANYSFNSDGTVAATLWQWDSDAEKGKTAYTQHRCTMDGITKNCYTYTPTGWIYPAKQYFNWYGNYSLLNSANHVKISWDNNKTETWSITKTSSNGLKKISFVSSNLEITHGIGFGSNANWNTYRTLPEIVHAGGLKKWSGQLVMAASDGSTITTRDWSSAVMNLSSFHSASWTSLGYTLHAQLPHSPNVCTGPCGGSHIGDIMYHLASTNSGRQMVYNNWCTCLSLEGEWPCYNRNMHPSAINSFLDDSGKHRGWLFVEQQDQPGSVGYQYQIGYFNDL